MMRPQRSRKTTSIGLKTYPKTKRFQRNVINNLHKSYDRIPLELRMRNPKIFKEKMKKFSLLPPKQII